jgi:hypothetical protein
MLYLFQVKSVDASLDAVEVFETAAQLLDAIRCHVGDADVRFVKGLHPDSYYIQDRKTDRVTAYYRKIS